MTELANDVDVVVVGAGLAGLAAARVTAAAGLHTVVLEASDGVGGRVRTDVVDGFRLDRGFQILLTAYPEVGAQLDLDRLRLCRFEPGARVWIGDRFVPVSDPFRRPSALIATARAPVGSIADKIRVALLRRDVVTTSAAALARRPDATTADALVARGFSSSMIERFFRPLFSGIQLDPALATTSRMFELIFRSLALGDAAVPADGMGAIPQQLAAGLPGGVVHLQRPVSAVEGTTVRLADGSVVRSRAVVVATDGPAASRLLGLPDPGSKAATCVWFAADEAPVAGKDLLLDGTGRGPACNVTVMSNVAPGYAPAGQSLVSAAVPGRADADAETAVRDQLSWWFGSQVLGWRTLRVDTIVHAQPVQAPHHPMKHRVRLGDGRYVCGDHRDTASIQGALFSGRRTGETVVADLRRSGA
jgi:phytoene dehydrogenase-like protein